MAKLNLILQDVLITHDTFYPAAYLSKGHFEFLLTEVLDILFTRLDRLWVVIFYCIYSTLIFFYGYVHKYQTQQCISFCVPEL